MDITKMSPMELMDVRYSSLADISVCQQALDMDVTTYGNGKSVQERLRTNRDNVEAIDAELARRKAEGEAQVEG